MHLGFGMTLDPLHEAFEPPCGAICEFSLEAIEDAYGDVPPPPSFVEGPTIVEVLWWLSPLIEWRRLGLDRICNFV